MYDAMQTTARSRIEKRLAHQWQSLFRFAKCLCGRPEKAMLLTERTLRLALDRSRSMPVPVNVRAWLISILFHQFLEARPRRLTKITACSISRPDSIAAPLKKRHA